MVSRSQLNRFGSQIDAFASSLAGRTVRVTVFRGETNDFALQRHRKLRPDLAGRKVWLEYRNEERDERGEFLATALCCDEDAQELGRLMARHDGETAGLASILQRRAAS